MYDKNGRTKTRWLYLHAQAVSEANVVCRKLQNMAGGVVDEMKQFRSDLNWMAVGSSSWLSTTAENSSEHCALVLAGQCNPQGSRN